MILMRVTFSQLPLQALRCQHLPPNPHQILVQQRLLLDPIDRLVQQRRRNLIELHARQPDQTAQNRRCNHRQSTHMARRIDEARARDTYLHIFAVRLFREVDDMILNPTLRVQSTTATAIE